MMSKGEEGSIVLGTHGPFLVELFVAPFTMLGWKFDVGCSFLGGE